MTLVEESCMMSARPDPDDETSTKREVDLAQVRFYVIFRQIQIFISVNLI